MSVYKILKYPHVLLRKKSTPIEKFTPDLKEFTEGLVKTMNAFEGIGLAAAQVGILKRVFVLDIEAYLSNPDVKEWHGSYTLKVDGKETPMTFPFSFINPEIVKSEGEVSFPYDGCLSFPGVDRGDSTRLKFIEVHSKTLEGKDVILQCDGIMSICIQHELDHLNGILFIDRLQNKVNEKEIVADIHDFEDSSEYRKALKKIAPTDARATKFGFL